jgi:uncharacterized membrane protein YjgN (DUF898 family)
MQGWLDLSLVWFRWKSRRDSHFATLHSNLKAKFVTCVVQFGSGPLFAHVLALAELTTQVKQAKAILSDLKISVTVSNMAYGSARFQSNGERKMSWML